MFLSFSFACSCFNFVIMYFNPIKKNFMYELFKTHKVYIRFATYIFMSFVRKEHYVK